MPLGWSLCCPLPSRRRLRLFPGEEHRHEAQRSSDNLAFDAFMPPSHMVHYSPTLVRIKPPETP